MRAEPLPQFSAYMSIVAKQLDGSRRQLNMEVGLGPGHIVLVDGDPTPLPIRGQSPQFSAHLYCSQTAGWIKMLLGTEVGLGPNDIVLHGAPTPPHQKGTALNFRSMSIVAERLYVSGYHLVRR